MRIVIEIENNHTTVTVDDETVGYEPVNAVNDRTIDFEPPAPTEDVNSYIGE